MNKAQGFYLTAGIMFLIACIIFISDLIMGTVGENGITPWLFLLVGWVFFFIGKANEDN